MKQKVRIVYAVDAKNNEARDTMLARAKSAVWMQILDNTILDNSALIIESFTRIDEVKITVGSGVETIWREVGYECVYYGEWSDEWWKYKVADFLRSVEEVSDDD